MKRLLIFLVIFLIGCSLQQTLFNSSISTKISKVQTQGQTKTTTGANPDAVVRCESDNETAVLYYGNGQKETFSPVCPEKEILAFLAFRQVYSCDGLNVKSRLTKCTGNQTCLKGECV